MRISDWSSDVCSSDLSREMTSGTPAAAIAPIDMTIDELRGALARVLPFHAAFDGWTDAALAASAGELNVPVERARLAFAGGAADMNQAWIAAAADEMAAAPQAQDAASLKVRDSIRSAHWTDFPRYEVRGGGNEWVCVWRFRGLPYL